MTLTVPGCPPPFAFFAKGWADLDDATARERVRYQNTHTSKTREQRGTWPRLFQFRNKKKKHFSSGLNPV